MTQHIREWVWIAMGLALFGLVACGSDPEQSPEQSAVSHEMEDPATSFARAIEEAHGLDAWRSKEAISARIDLTFGGNPALAGRMIFTPSMTKARLDQGDASVIWDGETAWVTPADAEFPRARFHVLTWPYFLAVPMKLRDPGARLELEGQRPLEGEPHETARLTFEEGIGDTPDDWYLVYRDGQTNRLDAMAYVVTYGTTVEEANREPHAIVYHDFQDVEGVAIPTRWTFRLWNQDEGVHGEPLGEATLSGVRFVTPEPGTFEVPDDAVEAPMPESPEASEAS